MLTTRNQQTLVRIQDNYYFASLSMLQLEYKLLWNIHTFKNIQQIINLTMTSQEHSRMTHLKDRSIHPQNDLLYEPLRNALRKSSVSHSLLLTSMSCSRVGKNIRSLSPLEAEIIKNNLYIPVDKELVPTRNLEKVLGKNFRAVDVNENVKQALTAEQFSKRPHGTKQEIIYEIKDEAAKNANIYTSRNNMQQSIYTSPHTFRESNKVINQINREDAISSTLQQQPRQSQIIRFNQEVSRQSPINSHAIIGSRADRHSTINIYTQLQQQSVNLPQNNIQSIQNQRQSLIAMNRSSNRVPTQFIQLASKPKNKRMSSISAFQNESNTREYLISQAKSTNDYNSRLYDFRTSKVSDKSTRISHKSRDEYKYNLFSALDEPGNTHCRSGCFSSNEIVAPKLEHNPWK